MIDLHTHTTRSDGTDTPSELVAAARRRGLDVVGITDHDTTAGWVEAGAAAAELGIGLVRGTEFTTQFDGTPVHILGYLYDPQDPTIVAHNERQRDERLRRTREIVERLAADYPITWADVEEQVADGASIGRPHIGDALVATGVVPNRSAAFEHLLATTSPYYVPQESPTTSDVVGWINKAGGKAVLAHPKDFRRGKKLTNDVIEEIASAGLFGIETDHRSHSVRSRRELKELAAKLALAPFGASDYHGRGKPNRLGEFTTAPDVLEALILHTYLEVS